MPLTDPNTSGYNRVIRHNIEYWDERVDLAAAFRWTARLNMHEAVANHFSLNVGESGRNRFLLNPNQVHFSRICASELLLLDAENDIAPDEPDAPDATAWALHGAIHRHCPHARCIMHAHPIFSTVLATLENPELPPIDQNTAMFYRRVATDRDYGGLALDEEGDRCAALLDDPKIAILLMGNHGVTVIGASVAEAFNRLYYFERAAETYIRALQTNHPLKIMPDHIAEKTAQQIEEYSEQAKRHFNELKAILDEEGACHAR